MNREIKFRAWDNINNEMRYPAKKDVFATGPTSGDFIDKWDNVMQFTGLHDKNGKEVYDKDILEYDGVRSFVTWGLDGWRFNSYMRKGTHEIYPYLNGLHGQEMAEIVGNMYESPEQLH